jgi:hypothetical protein
MATTSLVAAAPAARAAERPPALAEDGKTCPPPTATYQLEVQYLELKTMAGTIAPASMLEYEVKLDTETSIMTESAVQARALQITQQGAVLGPETDRRAIPAHRIQSVSITKVSTIGAR